MNNAYGSSYQTNEVMTTSREQLVPMMYRHLVRLLRTGARQIEEEDLEGKAETFGRAKSILYELLASLDPEVDDELAGQLAPLYTYFLQEIERASHELDADRLEPVIDMLSTLRESWEEAARAVSRGDADVSELDAETTA